MAISEGLDTYAGRLATFDHPHPLTKRRASSAKKKTATTVSWTHRTPSPDQLALAGFFYKPSIDSPDSVTCFLCNKALDGWDANDSPALEHLAHVPYCGWAINVCIGQRSQDMDRAEEDPLSEGMMEARRATFRDTWPHEAKKGWKCKIENMVGSGWCYSPLPEAEDCVNCFYCGLSLDGWEPKDDPWKEHQRRAPDCHFFSLIEDSAKTRRPKSKKRSMSRTSKAARLSTQSNVTAASGRPSRISVDNNAAEGGHAIMKTSSKIGKGLTRSTKTQALPKATQKASRDQQKTSHTEACKQYTETPPDVEDRELITLSSSPPGSEPKPKLKAKRRKVNNTDQTAEPCLPTSISPKPMRDKRKQTRLSDDASQLQSELLMSTSSISAQDNSKLQRGRKRNSDGLEKIDSSIVFLDEKPVSAPRAHQKRGRPTKRASMQLLASASSTAPNTVESEENEENEAGFGSEFSRKVTKVEEVTKQTVEDTAEASIEPEVQPLSHHSTPARSTAKSKLLKLHSPPQAPSLPISETAPLMPSPSAQSSDAENRPPSSRPSQVVPVTLPITQTARVPLAATTPTMLPSKRHVITAGLTSSLPWTPVDLETILLPTPSSRRVGSNQNMHLDQVVQGLTSAEKKMNVEEWILWNARCAEERLRSECEKLIGAFEGEGLRALRAMEGIECV